MKNKIRAALTVLFIPVFMFLVSCRSKLDRPETIIENGVEVAVNHLEPHKIKGDSSNFLLEEEFLIDTEDNKLAKLGLADIQGFDIDSEGNIYLLSPRSGERLVYKFNSKGNYVTSFGQKGQGPGELQMPVHLRIDKSNEIAVTDLINKRLSIFGKNGNLIKEIALGSDIMTAVPLEGGKYLVLKRLIEPNSEFLTQSPLSIYSSKFKEIKELDRQKVPNPMIVNRLKATPHVFAFDISNGRIYIGNEERGYEIHVYDLEGNLLRKIRKEYLPVKVPEEFKKEYLKNFDDPRAASIREKIYFPDSMPPFHSFFIDDRGILFVMTYEEGEYPGEYIYDIFNKEGIFAGRKSLGIFWQEGPLYAKAKENRFYCTKAKDSGYKELIVYKVNWKY